MNSIITYDTVISLLANPSNLEPRPNFFNLQALHTHFARALKWILCPQSSINGWSGAVMSREMYVLIDPQPFHLNIKPKTDDVDFPSCFMAVGVTTLPYPWEEILTITAEFTLEKKYVNLELNVFQAVINTLDNHVAKCIQSCAHLFTQHHWMELHNVTE
jgi:hypothetical protein